MQPKLISAYADISRRTLCLFMDETGHDEFKSGQRLFAIGGIAGFGPQVEHATRLWAGDEGEALWGRRYAIALKRQDDEPAADKGSK